MTFIVRIRNEEATLARSIRSLVCLTIPHEIILVLHCCTDRSPEIAADLASENPHIRIVAYATPISRPGYENTVTDASSDHSFVQYSNWCMAKARYPWVFRWDADFVMTQPLTEYINGSRWVPQNARIALSARNATHSNCEYYIHPSTVRIIKHVFWEYPVFPPDVKTLHLYDQMHIVHLSELSDLKSYWKERPWFEVWDTPEALIVRERYAKLVEAFGPEPQGLARASNPECTAFFNRIISKTPTGINLYA